MYSSDNYLTSQLSPHDPQQQFSINGQRSIPKETYKYLKQLQGDCIIKEHHLLKINYFKIIFLAFPFALTFIGLIILYQFEKVRLILMFSKIYKNATHIIVRSSNDIQRISPIYYKKWKNKTILTFFFENLQYQILNNDIFPLTIRIPQDLEEYCRPNKSKLGLTQKEAQARLQFYGKNQHLVKIPTFYGYMFNFMFLSLFTYIQYFTFLMYTLDHLYLFAYILLVVSFSGTLVNYYLIRKSYKQIKEIAQKQHYVQVLREGKRENIKSSELVIGDLYFPKGCIPCDSIIVQKDLFVSEVGFTGENIPIGKFQISDISNVFKSEHWAYEGSQIVSAKDDCLALVVNTGYSTRKGRIIRMILNKKPQQKDLFINILQLSLLMFTMSMCSYLALYHYMFDTIDNKSIAYTTLGIFSVNSIPSILLIFINFAYSTLLLRFKKNQIVCLKVEKTIESSRLKTICFDKTGTLTQNKVQIQQILLFSEQSQKFEVTSIQNLPNYPELRGLFATCHSIQEINHKLCGDEIDIKMFQTSNAILNYQKASQKTIFQVQFQNTKLQVHKVNQFQSKFQSMSVLVKNKDSGQFFIFAKGSPQKLHALSERKYPNFSRSIKQLSLEGYRTIAVSIRKIDNQEQFLQMNKCDREICLSETVLTALVTFSNKIKEDAPLIIKTLQQADITTKIITGDNIFVAVQTALTLEMVPLGSRVIVLQGNRIEVDGSIRAICVKKIGDKIQQEEMLLEDVNSGVLEEEYLAMDLDFIKKNQDLFRKRSCVIFARATPQLKAIIVKREKQQLQNIYNSRTLASRLFGGRIKKVAMVGDGANDLMAIQQANVGIGIIDSDAIYSADFTITSLSQIDTIIRQSKAGEQKIIETIYYQYYFNFVNVIQKALLTHDMSIVAFIPSLLKNFGIFYPLTWFICFTPPVDKLTKECPSFNLIGRQYLLIWWGSIIILAAGQSAGYFYYSHTSDFQPNHDRSNLNGNNKSATIVYLCAMMLNLFLYIGFSSSHPFKKPLYTNTPATILLTFAFIITTLIFFFSEKLSAFQIQPIGRQEAFFVYLIVISTGLLIIFYNKMIRKAELYKNQLQESIPNPYKIKKQALSI